MNMIDFFALIPFFLSILLEGLEDFEIVGKTGKIIRLIRVMRILRKVSLIFSTEKIYGIKYLTGISTIELTN